MVTIEIENVNAAFDDPGELARIIREVANALDGLDQDALVEASGTEFSDSNGNTVGMVTVS